MSLWKIAWRNIQQRAQRSITGIVNEDVDPSLLFQHPLNDTRDIFFLRNIQPVDSDTLAPQIFDGLEPSRRRADLEIPPGECGYKSPADTGRAPGYEHGSIHVVKDS